MASYSELRSLFSNSELLGKVEVACAIAANTIQNEATNTVNHAERLKWASLAYENPRRVGVQMLMAVLSANSAATVSQITGATDAQIQSNVDDAVDVFALNLT